MNGNILWHLSKHTFTYFIVFIYCTILINSAVTHHRPNGFGQNWLLVLHHNLQAVWLAWKSKRLLWSIAWDTSAPHSGQNLVSVTGSTVPGWCKNFGQSVTGHTYGQIDQNSTVYIYCIFLLKLIYAHCYLEKSSLCKSTTASKPHQQALNGKPHEDTTTSTMTSHLLATPHVSFSTYCTHCIPKPYPPIPIPLLHGYGYAWVRYGSVIFTSGLPGSSTSDR